MAITERTEESPSRQRIAWIVLGVLATMVAVVVAIVLLTRPPQMGADEDVFKSVDALYTAVRNQDDKRIGECEQRLHAQRDAGKLPKASAEYLDGVIAKARARNWESAVITLYDFMKAQRREGATEPSHKHEKKAGATKKS